MGEDRNGKGSNIVWNHKVAPLHRGGGLGRPGQMERCPRGGAEADSTEGSGRPHESYEIAANLRGQVNSGDHRRDRSHLGWLNHGPDALRGSTRSRSTSISSSAAWSG